MVGRDACGCVAAGQEGLRMRYVLRPGRCCAQHYLVMLSSCHCLWLWFRCLPPMPYTRTELSTGFLEVCSDVSPASATKFAKLLEGAFVNALEQCKGLGHEGEATVSQLSRMLPAIFYLCAQPPTSLDTRSIQSVGQAVCMLSQCYSPLRQFTFADP